MKMKNLAATGIESLAMLAWLNAIDFKYLRTKRVHEYYHEYSERKKV